MLRGHSGSGWWYSHRNRQLLLSQPVLFDLPLRQKFNLLPLTRNERFLATHLTYRTRNIENVYIRYLRYVGNVDTENLNKSGPISREAGLAAYGLLPIERSTLLLPVTVDG